jgi:hypothetical protein
VFKKISALSNSLVSRNGNIPEKEKNPLVSVDLVPKCPTAARYGDFRTIIVPLIRLKGRKRNL